MSAHLPPGILGLALAGLRRSHIGKVRDTYTLPDHSDLRLVVATDRLSARDFVLNTLMPEKGQILTALNIFWRRGVLRDCPSDLVAFGAGIDAFLPPNLRGNKDLQTRAIVVKTLYMLIYEMIVRGNLTGSSLKPYYKDGVVCGHVLPPGLLDGDLLDPAIFTPSTKAVEGHDEHVTAESLRAMYGPRPEMLALAIFERLRAYALERDIVLADTKMEFGYYPDSTLPILADEVGTPDSSRFWLKSEWDARTPGKPPQAYDKEIVRAWCTQVGIDDLLPDNPEHRALVHAMTVPNDIIEATCVKYHEIFSLLTGQTLREFQHATMGIAA